MKTISIINNKGGVGKTTTALNFGKELSNIGKRVLLIDLDPQKANLTALLRIKKKITVSEVILARATIEGAICQTKYSNLDILPADAYLSEAYKEYERRARDWRVLRNALEEIQDKYDYIIIDNAPAITIGTYISLTASNEVIVPMNIDAFGFYGLNGITKIIQEVKEKTNPSLYFAGCVLTRFIKDVLSENIADQFRARNAYPIFKTCIRETKKMRRSTFEGKAIGESSFRCAAAVDYRRLVKEYLEMCSL